MTTLPMTMRTNDDVLMAFLSLVRQERGLRPDRDVAVRTDDLDALAEALDLDDEELEERLMRVVGLTRRQAAELRAQLLRRRLTAGVVAMIAGIGLVTASRAFATGEVHVSAGDGGRVVRGDPYTRPTAAVTVATTPLLAAPASTTVVASTASTAPATTVTFGPVVTEGSPSTALTTPATLPAVVLAAEVEPVVGQVGRAGPPRTTPRPEVGPPATHAVDPVTTATSPPTTVVLPGPPTLPPPVTTASPPTTAPPAPTAPPTTTTVPTVSTIGGGGTTGTTEAPPPTTTTTTEPPTTTTTEPPTTTTTVAPTTTTTTAPPPTTTTEPPTTLAPPLTPVATP
jgi:hypothetical protein